MRMLYTSPRLQNIDMLVELLREHGIETRVTNVDGWRGRSHARFSYLHDRDSSRWPEVWVVKADDAPAARALLRQAGIEPAVRHADALAAARANQRVPGTGRRSVATFVRLGLLGAVVVLMLVHFLRTSLG